MSEHRHDPWNNGDLYTPDSPNPTFCGRCRNYGLWLTPRGIIAECPNLQLKFNDHPPLSAAAESVYRSGRRLAERGIKVEAKHVFSVACALTKTTTANRLTGHEIIDRFFEWGGSQKLRHFHSAIEELRSVWLLPVCSSKSIPYGYWIATDADDFLRWVEQTKSAPLKYLQTVAAVARANFHDLQLELDFAKEPVEETISSAA